VQAITPLPMALPTQEKTAPEHPASDDERMIEGSQPNTNDAEKQLELSVPSTATTSPSALPPSANHKAEPEAYLDPTEPPPLPYNLRQHKLTICVFWFLIVSEICFIPISFFYGLWFASKLNHGVLFAIITSVFGFITGYEYTARAFLLLLPRDEFRPLNGCKRFWDFDTTQWILVAPYSVMTGVLIGFSIPREPLVRGLALPMALGMIILGSFFILSGYAHYKGWKLRYFRLSSHAKGAVCPPLTFCIMEDVVAVDGGGGNTYRRAALKRYESSPRFRKMLIQILWFWAIPAVILGIVLIILIYTVRKEVAYGLGWGVPALWAALWTEGTILWTQRSLRIEKENWVSDRTTPP
jgi:hypothetical protein